MRCLLDLSSLGIEPDGRRAHLIPYGKECTLILDYKGIAELVMRSGLVASIHADKVCMADTFEVDRGKIVAHKINYQQDRGKAYAYYVIVTFKDGSEKCEVMTRDEVDGIRKRSKAGTSGPWVTDFDEMGKKTVFRRASKWLPLSPEIRDAMEKDVDSLADDAAPRQAKGREVPMSNPYDDGPSVIDESPQPTDDPPLESPTVVSEATERAQLLSDINETVRETEITFSRFGGLVKKLMFPNSTASLRDFSIEDLRQVHDNRLDIALDKYEPNANVEASPGQKTPTKEPTL